MKTIIFSSFLVLILFVLVPDADAQSDSLKEVIQKHVQVNIELDGSISVVHVIRESNEPRELEFIKGTVSNVKFVNEFGRSQDIEIDKDAKSIPILENQGDLIVTYDLDDVLELKDGVWTLDFRYLETTTFILPDGVDLFFVNERPVMLDKQNGFVCHGCEMILEYTTEQPVIIKEVNWEDQIFLVEFRTFNEIINFDFNQTKKEISFQTNGNDKFVNVHMPLKLLWEPYVVFLNNEKIPVYQDINNGTHVMINLHPRDGGDVSIIGTTVIPEFPIIAPLAIGFMMILLVPFMRKFSLH